MLLKKIFFVLVLFSIMTVPACKSGFGGINLFSINEDIKLGKQVSQQIESDSKQFPILRERGNEEVYRYIRRITTNILNSGKVKNKDNFAWQVKIIDDPKTLNAFATPGGYIYVYTGLIKFLDSEDQLAGVMGHEIAHADRRHSTRQMTQLYGVQALLGIISGKSDPGMIEQIAAGLVSLKFSRNHETESDKYSVIYLCGTEYNSAGAAGFFKKMEGQAGTPQFMSTHPNPGNRVKKIEEQAGELSCNGSKTNKSEYDRIKSLLK